MVSWWPFHRGSGAAASPSTGETSDTVPVMRGALDTKLYEDSVSGKARDYGDSGLAQSEIDRMRDKQKMKRQMDGRATVMDTESIDCLVTRFESQFQAADAHMQERVAQQRMLQRYDYDKDRRYKQWQEDQKALRERLQIHPLDTVVDNTTVSLVYLLRICTTAGLFYGVGRTAYLYRTMDKTYAKLNGVTLSGIAFHEIVTSVCKGTGVALCASAGIPIGDGCTSLCQTLFSDEVGRPERSWWNILGAGASCGFCGGAAFAAMHRKELTMWGIRAVVGGFTSLGTLAGLYLGYCVYRPYAMTREHGLYDPYWRPWHTRHLRGEGPGTVRGKYM